MNKRERTDVQQAGFEVSVTGWCSPGAQLEVVPVATRAHYAQQAQQIFSAATVFQKSGRCGRFADLLGFSRIRKVEDVEDVEDVERRVAPTGPWRLAPERTDADPK